MTINYQIMTDAQMKNGKFYLDYDKLIANASDEAEKEYIKEVAKWNFGFAYKLVYITKQTCGHYEIFQTPINHFYPLDDSLERAEERAKESKCTACMCNPFKPTTIL